MFDPDTMGEEELQTLYQWVDEIPLSRPKRNISRDFADGVMMAEMVKYFFPKLVEMHNYSPAQSVAQKVYNWNTLDAKVFKKINFQLSKQEIQEVSQCVPGAVERVLASFRAKVHQVQNKKLQNEQLSGHTASGLRASTSTAGGTRRNQRGSVGGYDESSGPHGKGQDDILQEKDETIRLMKEAIEILELKVGKLEQLMKIKDNKIQSLQGRLQDTQHALQERGY